MYTKTLFIFKPSPVGKFCARHWRSVTKTGRADDPRLLLELSIFTRGCGKQCWRENIATHTNRITDKPVKHGRHFMVIINRECSSCFRHALGYVYASLVRVHGSLWKKRTREYVSRRAAATRYKIHKPSVDRNTNRIYENTDRQSDRKTISKLPFSKSYRADDAPGRVQSVQSYMPYVLAP